MQNSSVLATSIAVLNVPQNITPAMKPPTVRNSRLKCVAGLATVQLRRRLNCLDQNPRRLAGASDTPNPYHGPGSPVSLKYVQNANP